MHSLRPELRRVVAFVVVSLVGCLIGACSQTPGRDPSDVRAELAAHRKIELERLHAYTEAGVFPENPLVASKPLHIFRDPSGRLCAVANLVHEDGLDDVVDRMAREHNDVTVADETSGPLYDWVLASGLTHEEVRRIQGVGFVGEQEALVAFGNREAERRASQERLREVERELALATKASLDVAVARRLEHSRAPKAAVASR